MPMKNLDQVTAALRFHIIDLVHNHDLRNDKEAQKLLREISDTFGMLKVEMEEVVPESILLDYYAGVEEAEKQAGNGARVFNSDGSVKSAFKSQIHVDALSETVGDTMSDLLAAYRTAEENSIGTIDRAISNVRDEISRGQIRGVNRTDVTSRVAAAFEAEGMNSFKTKDGRWLPLDVYSETVTATKSRQASVAGSENRYAESGTDLVEIYGNNPTCELCARYQGMVFSISGKTEGFPKLTDEARPPFHPRCQCGLLPVPIDYMSSEEVQNMKSRVSEFDRDKDRRSEYEKSRYESRMREKRQENADKKLFAKMQARMIDGVPDDFQEFRKLRRQGSSEFDKIYSDYLSDTHQPF